MDDGTLTDVLTAFRAATDACGRWAKAWHHWALFNAAAMEHYSRVAPVRISQSPHTACLIAHTRPDEGTITTRRAHSLGLLP